MDILADNVNSPIFIVGTARSGTTLTARILGRHSRIFISGETHFFDDIYSNRRELGDPCDPSSMMKIIKRLSTLYGKYNEPLDQERINNLFADVQVLEKFKHSCKNYREVFSLFMEIQMVNDGKMRWGNHTPRDIFNIDEILSFYPDAKILVCVRDVRDFILSYKYKWRATIPEHVDYFKRIYHPVVTSLLWKSSARMIPTIKFKFGSNNLLVVKYENLVRKPEEVIRKICEFIGEHFEEGMLDVDTYNSSFQVKSKGIFPDSVERWRRSLNDEEAYVAQLTARKELEGLGYSIEKIHVNPLKVLCIFISFPFALLRAVYNTKGRRGSMIAYMAKRVISLFS